MRQDRNLVHLDPNLYNELKYYVYQYNGWKREIQELRATLEPSGVEYDGMPHAKSTSASLVEKQAMRLLLLQKRVDGVEEAARRAAGDLAEYVLIYCTSKGLSFARLDAKYHVPCTQSTFFRYRALFFRHLAFIRETAGA